MTESSEHRIPREFRFTHSDFERIRKIIHKRAGISLSPAKEDMVYSRLARRLRATGIETFTEYLHFLEHSGGAEMEAFTNSLTTNLTAFFREPHHFPLLAEHIRKCKARQPLNLWCSASSTGEEAYSMAMTMVDLFNTYRPPVHILATDLDTHVLQKAQAGIYPTARMEKMPQESIRRFFIQDAGCPEGHLRVRRELRDMVSFRQVNLLDAFWPMCGPLEAIFCRNVMIYFDKETQRKVLKKFIPLLHEDGLLFAGHSENFYHASDLFKPIGKTVYAVAEGARKNAFHEQGNP